MIDLEVVNSVFDHTSSINVFISTLVSTLVSGVVVAVVTIYLNKKSDKEKEATRLVNEQKIQKIKYESLRELDKERAKQKNTEAIESNSYEIIQKFYTPYCQLLVESTTNEKFDVKNKTTLMPAILFFTQFDLIYDMQKNAKITPMAYEYVHELMKDAMKKEYFQNAFTEVIGIDYFTKDLVDHIKGLYPKIEKEIDNCK